MEQQFEFDPQLPALPLAFDLGAVARLFEEQGSAHEGTPGAAVRVRNCRLQDTKYQPSTQCVTTYELWLERSGEATWPTIGVVEIRPQGHTGRLFTADPALPWLASATDPVYMREHFARRPEDSTGGSAIEACIITPIRYKPGTRCVLRYDLHSPAGIRVFFGKLLAQDGDRLMAILSTLHEASRGTPDMPHILKPLAYWPEVHLLVQPAISEGAELNTLAFDPTADRAIGEQWLRAVGKCVAALHACAAAAGPKRTLQEDLHELAEYQAPMAQAIPALATQFAALCAALEAGASGLAASAPVASHGALRTDQFMIEDNRLVMIDLDSFCWADPARDLGNFLAYLRWKAIRRPEQASFIAAAAQAFLDGYGAHGPAPDPKHLAYYEAVSLLKIAGRRFRSLTVKEWPLVPQLLTAARTILQEAGGAA